MLIKRRVTALAVTVCLMLGTMNVSVSAAEVGTHNFDRINEFSSDTFADVTENDWFFSNVEYVYELGLMKGKADGFDPKGTITVAETITMLARIHSIYSGNGDEFTQGTQWYGVYTDYCIENGLIPSSVADYSSSTMNEPVTRSFFVMTFNSLPDELWKEINIVEDGAIPDVPADNVYAEYIYRAYRAGILTGSDTAGSFYPESNISRSEAAAVIGRIVDPAQRKSITLRVTNITLYAMNGDTVNVLSSEAGYYTARGWSTTPYTGGVKTIDQLLDEAVLDPVKTGYTPLDDKVDQIFSEIFTDDMTTSQKVKACYDYLIENCSYGDSGKIGDYLNIYLFNPYFYVDDNNEYQPGTSNFGMIYFGSALETHSVEAYCVMEAADMLDNNIGVCDNYSSAFAIMMRRIGLHCFPIYGSAKGGDSYSAHMITLMTLGGVDYVFDPQIEDVIADSYGYSSYGRYGKTLAELGDRYKDYTDIEECRKAFGRFFYDPMTMALASGLKLN